MKQQLIKLAIRLKPRHCEELRRLQEALGGVSPSAAIAFLIQSQAPRAIQVINSNCILQQETTICPQLSLKEDGTTLNGDFWISDDTKNDQLGTKENKTTPIVAKPSASEAEAVLNALMGM